MIVLRRAARVFLPVLLVLGSLATAAPVASAATRFWEGPRRESPGAEADLAETVNRLRTNVYGLAPLRVEEWDGYQAYIECVVAENADARRLAHVPPSCNQPLVEAEILAVTWSSQGGNVGVLADLWNGSDPHRRIMLGDADYMRVGVFCLGQSAYGIIWVGSDGGSLTPREITKKEPGQNFYTNGSRRCDDQGFAQLPAGSPDAFAKNTSISNLIASSRYEARHADTLRLYRAFFDRDPDVAGAAYWLELRDSGYGLDEIAQQFALSAEFRSRYGSPNNAQFLAVVYRNVLGRNYDQRGFNYWLNQMNGGLSRGGVVRWVAANQEFIRAHPFGSTG